MNFKKLTYIFDKFISPVFFVFATILVLLEFTTYTNFVLETFGIDYVDTFAFSSLLFGTTLIRKPKSFYSKHWKKIIFILPLVFFTGLSIVFMRYHLFYLFLEKEDSVIEWLQFFLIAISSISSFLLYKKWKQKNKILGTIFLLIAIGFFLVAGEEISWGQRIFNFQTPQEYAKVNIQEETTLHNYGPVFGLVYRGYIVVGLIGAFSWVLRSVVYSYVSKSWKKLLSVLIPNWYYFGYFITAAAYNYERFFLHHRVGTALWEESMELLLFFGVTLFLLEQLVIVSKLKFKKGNEK